MGGVVAGAVAVAEKLGDRAGHAEAADRLGRGRATQRQGRGETADGRDGNAAIEHLASVPRGFLR